MRYAIETQRLVKVYPSGDAELTVLKGIDLAVASGEFVSIMGPSGSGKSTLLNLIGILDAPTSGRLLLDGRDVSSLGRNARARARRQSLGFVFQSFHLLPRATAFQNVMLPMTLAGMPMRERHQRATELLDTVGLADRSHHRPAKLSGGQKQRVAIARALAMDPPIILADEPTGNLDSTTSRDIMALFQRLHDEGKTIVQVTHDAHMARYGDRIIHFADGKVRRVETRPSPRGPVAPREAFAARPIRSTPNGRPGRTAPQAAMTPRRTTT